ncbi:transposable element Tcb1 transposase [Trichonephila clavipes]|nr:transposable element Tcb1 transposase [Trichonephila clavipes]
MCFDFILDLSNESVNFAFAWLISGVVPEFSESIFSSDKLSYVFRKAEVWCVNYPSGRGSRNLEQSHLEVSEELGIAQSVISRLWQRLQDDGNVSRCYSTGRPRVTMMNEDQYIYIYLAVTAKRNRRSTELDMSRQLSSATGTTVSRQTEYRRLGHIGLYARRPVRCVPLTATHCRPAINLE